jgi:O-acetyl-ADP-ribose deacetylase (regulator of RNase III)
MKKIRGNLIELALSNQFDVIVHGCNCLCNMGAGIAKSIKQNFPEAYEADKKTPKGDKDKLGTISQADLLINGEKLTIVNAYTQYTWRGKTIVNVDYEAIRKAFRAVKQQFSGLRIGYPAVGAGSALGDWKIISQIIDEELEGEDHTFVLYNK